MKVIRFNEADEVEPQKSWLHKSMCNDKVISIEYFEKPPKHSSPFHSHSNSQILYVLSSKLQIDTESESQILDQNDSVFIDSNEIHKIVNPTDEISVGLDIFIPGRSFDFWEDKLK
jgi:quercetin dioxygenase-like cupin family protein